MDAHYSVDPTSRGEEGYEAEYAEGLGGAHGAAPYLSVFEWAERMHEYADDMDLGGPDGGGEDLRVQRFYTGRGSLWKPPSNMQRIGRQEARMIASAIHNDSTEQMHRILSSSQSTLFESLRRPPPPSPQRWSNGYAPRRGKGHSTMDHTGRSMLSNVTHKSKLAATQTLSNTLSSKAPLAPVEKYNPRRKFDAIGRKYPPLRSMHARTPAPPNRIMQHQWGVPMAHAAPLRTESAESAANRRRESALNRRLAALPGISVASSSGVGGVIDLTPLQNRCGLDELRHEFVSEEEVKRIIAEVGTDMQFLDDSGLGKLTEMANVPLASPRSRDAEEEEAAAEESETVQHRNSLLTNTQLRGLTTGELQLANQPFAPRQRPRNERLKRIPDPRFQGLVGTFRTTPRFPVPIMDF